MDAVKPYVESSLSWIVENPRKVLLIGTGVTAILAYNARFWKYRNLPPGPRTVPFFGNVLSMTDRWHEVLQKYAEKHGSVYTIYFFNNPVIILTSYEAIKEAFVTHKDDFSDRQISGIIDRDMFKDELFNSQFNEKTAEKKKFASQALKTFGSFKGLEIKIQEGVDLLMNNIPEDEAVNPHELFNLSATNIIINIVLSESYSLDDPALKNVHDLIKNWYQSLEDIFMLEQYPKLISKLLFRKRIKTLSDNTVKLRDYIIESTKRHEETLDPSNLRDFVDVYLAKRDVIEMGQSFYDTTIAFLPDASQTMGHVLRWVILYVTKYPEIKKKMQDEIDKVVGKSRKVTFSDRSSLCYTDAVIYEMFRHTAMSTATTIHTAYRDTVFRGYHIPKGTGIMACLYTTYYNPEIFPDPDSFNPDRFIGPDGGLINTQYVNPFGMGRRMCLGENLVKMEVFLTIASIYQKYTTVFPENENPSLEADYTFLMLPKPFKIIFKER